MRKKQPNIITPEKSAHNFELSSAASDPLRDDPEFKKGLNQVLREKLIQMRQYDDQVSFIIGYLSVPLDFSPKLITVTLIKGGLRRTVLGTHYIRRCNSTIHQSLP
jgi:hypothetical protein